MIHSLEASSVVVLLGPGGVGKTSCSLALAIEAARMGRQVALLSIDPAKRLAAAMGMSIGHRISTIKLPPSFKGSLHAAMLDAKQMFDAMVRRHAPSPEVAEKILEHQLYYAASTKLSGSLEYMALAMLQDLIDDARYDLVVVDTPPDVNALDFLARPDVLGRFQEKRVMNWLVKPFHIASKIGVMRLMSVGERLMGGVAQVTGVKALHAFAEFLILIQQIIDGFHNTSKKISRTLRSQSTAFFLVSTATPAVTRATMSLGLEMHKLGFSLQRIVVNRCLPDEVALGLQAPTLDHHPFVDALKRRKLSEQSIVEGLRDEVRSIFGKSSPITMLAERRESLESFAAILDFAKCFSMPEGG